MLSHSSLSDIGNPTYVRIHHLFVQRTALNRALDVGQCQVQLYFNTESKKSTQREREATQKIIESLNKNNKKFNRKKKKKTSNEVQILESILNLICRQNRF